MHGKNAVPRQDTLRSTIRVPEVVHVQAKVPLGTAAGLSLEKSSSTLHVSPVAHVHDDVERRRQGVIANTEDVRAICARLISILADETYRELAERLGLHPETLRRYIISGPPGIEFYQSLHREGYSIDWIVGGTYGPRRVDHPRPLADIPTHELFAEIGRRHDALDARIAALADGLHRMQGKSHLPASPRTQTATRMTLSEVKSPVRGETNPSVVIGQIGVETVGRSDRR